MPLTRRHFWLFTALVNSDVLRPVKISLNWFIPALAKSNVGSSAGTIGELGIKHKAFVKPLIAALSDKEESDLCRAAAKTIVELGIKDKRFIKPLIKLLQEQTIGYDSSTCDLIVDFLGKIGDKTTIPALKKLIELELYKHTPMVNFSIKMAIENIERRELVKPPLK